MSFLAGKAVVVTGSGRGIGATVARLAAQEGASVVVNDIDKAEADRVAAEIVKAGGKAVANASDISKWDGARALIECCVDSFGVIDGLVNNAGVYRLGRVDQVSEKDFRDTIDSNVVGTLFTVRHAAPHMIKRKQGSIVNVTSGAHMGLFGQAAYGASKGAAASFTYACSIDLREFNIRVNALSPMAATRMGDQGVEFANSRGLPAPVLPAPEKNAPLVVYLLSDEARGVNGQVVRMDDKRLSLVAHPGIGNPVLERDAGWDVASIAQAFREELGKRQYPLGLVALNVQRAEYDIKNWK
jgi:NAD(P)-dependent dehydrogenase (short-subunit alcohol dehydrogenase family)